MDFKLKSARKRRRRQKKRSANRDIISSLPDVILSHILSFCSTKDAAKTSILSRRWRYTWISIPNLDFDDQLPRAYSAVDANLFTESVNRVLHRRDEAIKSFSLQVCNPYMSIEDINQLIFAAIRHNFEEFMLECHICVAQLPGNLYSCRTIKNLKLHGSIFLNIPESASFPNLKSLTLEDLLDANDNSIAKIIYFSPFLEQLSITTCSPHNVMNLHIKSSSLKSLTIHVWNRDDEIPPILRDTYTITIDTPNLDFLDFDDHAYDVYSFSSLSLLTKAVINICLDWYRFLHDKDKLLHILSRISSVKDLNLSEWTLLCLKIFFLPFFGDFPFFYNLTNLKVEVVGEKWLVVPHILKHVPNLKVLVVQNVEDAARVEEEVTLSFDEGLFLFASLERLEMQNFRGNSEEMKFAKYMLKHGTNLNTVVITCKARYGIKKFNILKELTAFPRASKTCQVLFS